VKNSVFWRHEGVVISQKTILNFCRRNNVKPYLPRTHSPTRHELLLSLLASSSTLRMEERSSLETSCCPQTSEATADDGVADLWSGMWRTELPVCRHAVLVYWCHLHCGSTHTGRGTGVLVPLALREHAHRTSHLVFAPTVLAGWLICCFIFYIHPPETG
jgi:hypothetical protein